MSNKFAPKKTAPAAEIKSAFISPETKKLTADIDANLHQELKMLAVTQGRPMRAIIEEALEAYFRK